MNPDGCVGGVEAIRDIPGKLASERHFFIASIRANA